MVEFDLQDWQKREWINVYKDNFHLLLIEDNLVLAPRTVEPFSKDGNLHPALVSLYIYIYNYLYMYLHYYVKFLTIYVYFVFDTGTNTNSIQFLLLSTVK